MEKIQLTAKFKIHAGKFDEAKTIADECIAIVKEKEEGKGTLRYDWYLSPDQTECVVQEMYADSNAVLIHIGDVQEQLGKIFAISDFTLEVYGNPSAELQKATTAFAPNVYFFYQGM